VAVLIVGLQFVAWSMSQLWHFEIWGSCQILLKILQLWLKLLVVLEIRTQFKSIFLLPKFYVCNIYVSKKMWYTQILWYIRGQNNEQCYQPACVVVNKMYLISLVHTFISVSTVSIFISVVSNSPSPSKKKAKIFLSFLKLVCSSSGLKNC
jgi:hypothetical protein